MLKRLALTLFLALSLPAQAAITFVDSTQAETGASTSVTCNKPTGTAEDDVMIASFNNGQDDGTTPTSTGWTNIDFQEDALGADGMSSIFYKVAGASEGSSYTFDYPSSTSNLTTCVIATFRGVDTASVLDVTYSSGSHYIKYSNDQTPAPQPVTTVSANAFVITTMFSKSNTSITGIAPSSGYTEAEQIITANRYTHFQYIDAGAAGVETPGDVTHTGGDGTEDPALFTIALKPAAAASTLLLRLRQEGQ